jgi:hypothetical protein
LVSDGTRERELQLIDGLVVGRDPTCDISYEHSLLSRRHAEFLVAGDKVTVRDLGSRNGVFVNGTRAAECVLSPGDVLQIGPLRARYLADGAPMSIAPEQMDEGATALLRNPPSVAAAAAAPADDDDEVTRLIQAPPPSSRLAEAAPLEAADADEDVTRFVGAPTAVREAAELAVPLAPSGPLVASSPVAAPPPASTARALTSFVYVQLLAFVAVIVAAAAAGIMVSNGAVTVAIAIPAVVGVITVYVIGQAIVLRIERTLGEARHRT